MKTRLLTLAAFSFSLGASALAAENTLIDLDLAAAQAGNPPPTETFNPDSVNNAIESTTLAEGNDIQVVSDAPGFPGKALRFIKGAEEPRTPSAVLVNHPGLVTSGKVRFTWEADLESFTAGEKFPGFEALLTFVLRDGGGKPFFTFYYLVDGTEAGGTFGCGGQKLGAWSLGTKQQFEVTLDLDAGTALVKVDGEQVGEEQKIDAQDGLRVVQFSDGAGLAYYGSKFTATMAKFKMTTL